MPLAVYVIDPIFNVWIFFVVLVLFFVIGIRKRESPWPSSSAGAWVLSTDGYSTSKVTMVHQGGPAPGQPVYLPAYHAQLAAAPAQMPPSDASPPYTQAPQSQQQPASPQEMKA